jgi:hypothetical protein
VPPRRSILSIIKYLNAQSRLSWQNRRGRHGRYAAGEGKSGAVGTRPSQRHDEFRRPLQFPLVFGDPPDHNGAAFAA